MNKSKDSVWSNEPPAPKFATAIVGPNPLLRESLSRFLEGSNFEIVSLWATMDELINSEEPIDQNVLAIIDVCNQPDEVFQHIEKFLWRHPLARIVVLAKQATPSKVAEALRSGAHGYLATVATRSDFIKSLELVMSGQTIIPSEAVFYEANGAGAYGARTASPLAAAAKPAEPIQIPQFSDRELYILKCLTEGFSNKLIARECDIAEGTAKVHVKAILRKLKVSNRTQAAIWAYSNQHDLWPAVSADAGADVQPAPVQNGRCAVKPITRHPAGAVAMDRGAHLDRPGIEPIAANSVHA